MTPKILAVGSEKGGVGKTTTAVTIAHALALQEYNVLLIDLDSQGNCAVSLGLSAEKTTYDALVLQEPIERCVIQARAKLDLLASNHRMANVKNFMIAEGHNSHMILRNTMDRQNGCSRASSRAASGRETGRRRSRHPDPPTAEC